MHVVSATAICVHPGRTFGGADTFNATKRSPVSLTKALPLSLKLVFNAERCAAGAAGRRAAKCL